MSYDSRAARWTARITGGLVVLFLVFDGVMKLAAPPPVVDATRQLGWPADAIPAVGALLLACVALTAVPRTRVVGAIATTAYLGGAVALQVRVGNPAASHALFPVYMGALLWAALWLRDPRVRALVAAR